MKVRITSEDKGRICLLTFAVNWSTMALGSIFSSQTSVAVFLLCCVMSALAAFSTAIAFSIWDRSR